METIKKGDLVQCESDLGNNGLGIVCRNDVEREICEIYWQSKKKKDWAWTYLK